MAPAVPATVVNQDYVWTLDKPLTLKGTAGSWQWDHVMFAAKTIRLSWSATPSDATGCAFKAQLESKSLAKTVKISGKTTSAKATKGTKNATIKYGDGVVKVTTDCLKWSIKITPTGHPGVVIKKSTDTTKTTATTALGLNDALAESQADWWLSTNYTYYGSSRPRVSSVKVTTDITYELPKWTPPVGADPALVAAYDKALAGMKRHTQGEAVIGVQTAGRFLASASKRSFTSVKAMKKYFDGKSDKWLDWARDKQKAYDEANEWGLTQGAYLP